MPLYRCNCALVINGDAHKVGSTIELSAEESLRFGSDLSLVEEPAPVAETVEPAPETGPVAPPAPTENEEVAPQGTESSEEGESESDEQTTQDGESDSTEGQE